MPPTPPGTLADYNEIWPPPSTRSWESMPLGNGETTLNVWVEGNGDLLFFIGRSDAESENNRNIKLDWRTLNSATAMADAHLISKYYAHQRFISA